MITPGFNICANPAFTLNVAILFSCPSAACPFPFWSTKTGSAFDVLLLAMALMLCACCVEVKGVKECDYASSGGVAL